MIIVCSVGGENTHLCSSLHKILRGETTVSGRSSGNGREVEGQGRDAVGRERNIVCFGGRTASFRRQRDVNARTHTSVSRSLSGTSFVEARENLQRWGKRGAAWPYMWLSRKYFFRCGGGRWPVGKEERLAGVVTGGGRHAARRGGHTSDRTLR